MELDSTEAMARLSDRVFQILKKEILAGRLVPGQHLALEDLAQTFGVSTTPVRDALSALVGDGLVEWRPRRGAFVAHLTPQLVKDLFQIREFLECCAADYAVLQGPALAAEMQRLLEEIGRRLAAEPQREGFTLPELELRFHSLPVESVGNSKLTEIYHGVSSIITISFALYPLHRRRLECVVDEHQALVDALRNGDAAAARDAVRTHLRNGRDDLLRRLEEAQARPQP